MKKKTKMNIKFSTETVWAHYYSSLWSYLFLAGALWNYNKRIFIFFFFRIILHTHNKRTRTHGYYRWKPRCLSTVVPKQCTFAGLISKRFHGNLFVIKLGITQINVAGVYK